MPFYPNGTGSSLGDTLALAEPLQTSLNILYVHHTGVALSALGTPERPYATLEAALAASANGSVIVLMDGHTETCDEITVSTEVTIVGEGTSQGIPTVELTFTAGSGPGMTITAKHVELRNIRFPERAALSAHDRIFAEDVTGLHISNCYFDFDENDGGNVLECLGGIATTIENTTLVSTATAQPDDAGIPFLFDGTTDGLYLNGVTLDGGTYGFPGGVGMVISQAEQTSAGVRALNVSLLRGADVSVNGVARGYFNVAVSTGSARVRWAV